MAQHSSHSSPIPTEPSIPFHASSTYIHHTWARTFHSHPELYVRPRTLAEIQKAVSLARRCRRRLVVVGCAHSPSDLTASSAWMMNLDQFNAVLKIQKRGSSGTSGIGADEARVTVQAGIRLHDLNEALRREGLTLPNLGSIDVQSLAGALATATHGSSMRHGPLHSSVRSLQVCLASGEAVRCGPNEREDLFRAALVSLGAVGVVTEVEFAVVKDTNIEWTQTVVSLEQVLDRWERGLWTQAEYVRCWWVPYLKKMVLWTADKTDKETCPPPKTWYGGSIGFWTYHTLLWIAHYLPSIIPTVEWFVFGMQFGFRNGGIVKGVGPQREELLLDCLFSQFVDEWALPLEKGPEAISRLSKWIHGDEEGAKVPFPSKGAWAHWPIEVRVGDGSKSKPRAYMDPSVSDGPTLYLNAILYRPYGLDPYFKRQYYQGFEFLMKELGGKPHWAKNFQDVTSNDIQDMYGDDLSEFLKVRNEVDPDGMFIGHWHRRYLLSDDIPTYPLEEREVSRSLAPKMSGGIVWTGEQAARTPLSSSGSNESFDVLHTPAMEDTALLMELKKDADEEEEAIRLETKARSRN